MANTLVEIQSQPGHTDLYIVQVRQLSSARQARNVSSHAWETYDVSHWSSYVVALTEGAPGYYYANLSGELSTGTSTILVYQKAGASASATADQAYPSGNIYFDGTDITDSPTQVASGVALSSAGTTSLSTALDTYLCDIQYTRDRTTPKDQYTVTFYKNGIRQTSGIVSPTIQVIKRADGTDLIAQTSLTQIGTTGSYKKDATTTARLTPPAVGIAVVTATVNGTAMSFSKVVGRDN